jgi:hypothetical protein
LRPWRKGDIIRLAFLIKESLILDKGGNSQSSRHRAEAMARSCIPYDRRQSRSQNLGKQQLVGRLVLKPPRRINAADRGAGKSRKDPSTYATAYCNFDGKTSNLKARSEMRLCVRVDYIHAAHFHIMFLARLLEAPPSEQNCEGAPLSFLPRRSGGTQQN